MLKSNSMTFTNIMFRRKWNHHKKEIPNILLFMIFALSIYVLFLFYTRGFIPHDEGWIINPAQRITQGDIPYKDFHYIYTPGVAYIISLGFTIFGTSVLTSRLITLAFSLLSLFLLFLITKRLTTVRFGYLTPSFLFLVWMPLHINFAWPVLFAICSGLSTCYLFLLFQSKQNKYFVLSAGITTGLTLLLKQNFGLALLLTSLMFFIFEKRAKTYKNASLFIIGFVLFPLVMCVYFYFTSALFPFFSDMYFFMVTQIILKGHQSTPFIYPDIWYKEIAKTLFYTCPLIFSVIAGVIVYKKNKNVLFLIFFTIFYYLLGIRPTTDFMHLVPLLSLTGIPLLIILIYGKNKLLTYCTFIFFFVSIMIGVYSSLFMNYYRWDTPLLYQNKYTQNQRLGVLTDSKYQQVVPQLTNYIDANSAKNSYLFIYTFSPSIYILADRKNPTKFIFLPASILSQHDENEIIETLSTKNVPIILTDSDITNDSSKIALYIKKRYVKVKTISNYTLWKNRHKPISKTVNNSSRV